MSNPNGQPAFNGVLYIGSYGTAEEPTIHVCTFEGSTGKLSVIQQEKDLENASFLTLHPNGDHLYAVSETESTGSEIGGSAVAFDVDGATGLLRRKEGRFLTHGAHPCYISTDASGQALFAANYTGGNVALLPIKVTGALEAAASVSEHAGELGPNAARQDAPHAHCIIPMGTSAFVCAVDLGIDAILIYRYDAERHTLSEHGIAKVHRGAGPRHLIFHPNLPAAYVMNELDSTISVLRTDLELGTLAEGQVISALPADYKDYNDAADIHLSPNGRYLYSSNRGHNSIAVFVIDQENGALSLIQHISCGGESPRNFAISPDGSHLLVAHQKSGTIVVFNVDIDSGLLAEAGSTLELPSPVCIQFGKNLSIA